MKFSEYETIVLLKDLPEEGLKKGDLGAIIMVYSAPHEAYEVEFVDLDGVTKAQLALLPDEIGKYHTWIIWYQSYMMKLLLLRLYAINIPNKENAINKKKNPRVLQYSILEKDPNTKIDTINRRRLPTHVTILRIMS